MGRILGDGTGTRVHAQAWDGDGVHARGQDRDRMGTGWGACSRMGRSWVARSGMGQGQDRDRAHTRSQEEDSACSGAGRRPLLASLLPRSFLLVLTRALLGSLDWAGEGHGGTALSGKGLSHLGIE